MHQGQLKCRCGLWIMVFMVLFLSNSCHSIFKIKETRVCGRNISLGCHEQQFVEQDLVFCETLFSKFCHAQVKCLLSYTCVYLSYHHWLILGYYTVTGEIKNTVSMHNAEGNAVYTRQIYPTDAKQKFPVSVWSYDHVTQTSHCNNMWL